MIGDDWNKQKYQSIFFSTTYEWYLHHNSQATALRSPESSLSRPYILSTWFYNTISICIRINNKNLVEVIIVMDIYNQIAYIILIILFTLH